MTTEIHHGGCLCGQVRYRVTGPLAAVIACHCKMCRRTSGHYVAATAAARDRFELTESSGLAWYQSSETSRRGVCKISCSSLIFDRGTEEPMGIAAGSLDGDPALSLVAQIYVDEAGRYYTIREDGEAFDGATWRRGGWRKFRDS